MQTMMPPFVLLLVLCAVLVAACDRPPGDASTSENESAAERPARPVAVEQGKFFERDGTRYLWGGEDPEQHFVVDNLILEPEQFHYGIGREHFPALIEPAFVAAEAADAWLPDTARVLGLQVGDDVRAYPIDLLIRHEVVNDVVGGEPVFAAYCILADLGAVYDRRIDGRVHTFALSGYTYYDPEVWDGMDGFVLWDRETESLWWPLIGKAVSGPMLHTPLPVYDEDRWTQTTWGAWKADYPEAQVLEPGQDVDPPASWPQYEVEATADSSASESPVAPRWGENAEVR